MENATRLLAGFAAGLGYDALDRDLVARFKTYLLDAVGCGLHGSTQPWARIVNRFVKRQGGRREATLWLQHHRGPAANVALGLGVMIHSFDFDDYHNAKIHPGAPVMPAALAVGEAIGASGREVLAAMAAGYETMVRVSLATGPNASRLRGWHLTGTTGTFGAAAAAGNLLGFNEEEMASALGMAGTQSAGLWAFTADGAMSKRFHPGRAAQSGVLGAMLARDGFKGPTRILEADDCALDRVHQCEGEHQRERQPQGGMHRVLAEHHPQVPFQPEEIGDTDQAAQQDSQRDLDRPDRQADQDEQKQDNPVQDLKILLEGVFFDGAHSSGS